MKITQWFVSAVLGAILLNPAASRAQDIDLYSGVTGGAGIPNVLFVLDNAANFSSSAGTAGGPCMINGVSTTTAMTGTVGGIEQCALYNVVAGLPTNADGSARLNLGLMFYNNTGIFDVNGQNCNGTKGGCLVQQLVPMDTAHKASFLAWLLTWQTASGQPGAYVKASQEATGATIQEAWAYFAGQTGLSGRDYSSIQPANGCQKNFVIFVGNSFSSAGTPGDGDAVLAALQAASGVTATQTAMILDTVPTDYRSTLGFECGTGTTLGTFTFPSTNHQQGGYYADEWARFMYQTDLYPDPVQQNIVTYSIGLLSSSCKSQYAALLTTMAEYGGGKYFPTSGYDGLVVAILKILNEVQAVNSVFASSSLPVSVNAQGTYLNQIYMGMFRPDSSGLPRWVGNLKQYQFGFVNGQLSLVDALGNQAISGAGTGFISSTAVSFWTSINPNVQPDSGGGFWRNHPQSVGGGHDSPDGEIVEKGGSAEVNRLSYLLEDYTTLAGSSTNPRNVYTYCPSGTGCIASLTDSANAFSPTNSGISASAFGTATTMNVTAITRAGTTVTVTTQGAHGFSNGDSITIGGATPDAYNGVFAISYDPAVNPSNQFTYQITVRPVTPATPTGGITANVPFSAQAVPLNGLTHNGNTANVYLPNHGYVVGQQVTIGGANPDPYLTTSAYNGSFTITNVVDANNFQYTISENPVSPAGNGSASVSVTTKKGTITYKYTIDTPGNNGVQRTAGSTKVTFTTTSNNNTGFTAGATVSITGVVDGAGRSVQAYTGVFTILTTPTNNSFTISIPSSALTPTPATGTITVSTPGANQSVVSIQRLNNSDTTATVNLPNHGFVTGQLVTIQGADQLAYDGTFPITVIDANDFSFPVVTTPSSPATGLNMTATKFGAAFASTLINWLRGQDNYGDEPSPDPTYTTINVRPSYHGDVLHSRPTVVNYGGSTGVVVYYGANDGLYRAVNGNQTASIGSVPPGGELWSLSLPEFFAELARQRYDSPMVLMPSTPPGILPAPIPRDYFVDGASSIYQKMNASGTTDLAYLYLAMRRGGQFMYALNVTSPTGPSFQWKIDPTGLSTVTGRVTGTETDYAELAQTWSQPAVAYVKGYCGGAACGGTNPPSPVLIFGGGYDNGQDQEPPPADDSGRAIYIVDALTGQLVWKATSGTSSGCSGTALKASCTVVGMNYSIPADLTLMDAVGNDGYIDRIYATDVGGNIWRVDLETSAGITPDTWKVTQLAALGCDTGACPSGTTPRKFLYPADVISTPSYTAVLVGSGDREHPLYSTAPGSSYNVQNDFFMVKDTNVGSTGGTNLMLTVANLENINTNTSTGAVATAAYDGLQSGYYIKLGTGEKVVNAATTLAGYTYFGTSTSTVPGAFTCATNLGTAKGYQIGSLTGTSHYVVYDGGGLPPTAVAGSVNVNVNGQNVLVPFCIGCGGDPNCAGADCKSASGGHKAVINVPTTRSRTYWYMEID